MEVIRGEIVGLEFDCEIDECSIMSVAYPKNHRIGHQIVMIMDEKDYDDLCAKATSSKRPCIGCGGAGCNMCAEKEA
ncbi:MAG: hypothetical protein WC905_02590 [Patescibacteria group bacterium]|jgi:hypothetical protein